jgi:hypothetical protein
MKKEFGLESGEINNDLQSEQEANFLLNDKNLENILVKIGQIEGQAWVERQRQSLSDEDNDNSYSLGHALKAAQRAQIELNDLRRELEAETDQEERQYLADEIEKREEGRGSAIAEIYGNNGFNRYYVRPNGDIVLSAQHIVGGDRVINLAKELGLKVE